MSEQEVNIEDQYEMKYKYIYMKEIEGNDKMSVSKALMNCQDIKLFEQESIQNIINYKWKSYAERFFLTKFIVYTFYLIVYYIDLESIHGPDRTLSKHDEGIHEQEPRYKGTVFVFCKCVCGSIQLIFSMYELLQIKMEPESYLTDPWNYLENADIVFFFWSAYLDVVSETVTE